MPKLREALNEKVMFNDVASCDWQDCCINTVYSIGVINDSTMIHHAAILVLHVACFASHCMNSLSQGLLSGMTSTVHSCLQIKPAHSNNKMPAMGL